MTDQGRTFQGPSRGGRGGYSSYGSGYHGGQQFKRQRFDNKDHRGSRRGGRGSFRGRRGTYQPQQQREGASSNIAFDIRAALSNPWKDLEDELGLEHCQVDIIERTESNIMLIPPDESPEPESSTIIANPVATGENVDDYPSVEMPQEELANEDEISIDIDNNDPT
ncbi:hypothetical protein POJ06DRAFT_256085 [Lipomyces tetrasporus]|uniref:Uncharacterized protein n=1 Tax=Lipomyces tetrasporus TaxID=54092 RepID=A0AAD7QPJ0_9ASCO|nr:uncharacterized protein POJ06DRAFT_256085 [Lipomyces tetrasporus]KAJ8099133.1 hypothetical protein POJ06DRAFT_256085 [Lipomyces tetrasporus]